MIYVAWTHSNMGSLIMSGIWMSHPFTGSISNLMKMSSLRKDVPEPWSSRRSSSWARCASPAVCACHPRSGPGSWWRTWEAECVASSGRSSTTPESERIPSVDLTEQHTWGTKSKYVKVKNEERSSIASSKFNSSLILLDFVDYLSNIALNHVCLQVKV